MAKLNAKLINVPKSWSKGAPMSEYQCEVVKGKSISILKGDRLCNTFCIGDEAEYDSYNLIYTGRITSISETTVVVTHGSKEHPERTFLYLYKFCVKNEKFDAQEVAQKNAIESQCI